MITLRVLMKFLKAELIIYVHARNAILGGISPKANRTIPPLNYEFINKIKQSILK